MPGKLPRELISRLGWAGAAWVVLSGQYLMYIFWDLAQRESFFDWFLLSSLGLQLYAQGEQAYEKTIKAGRTALAIAGFLSVTMWFGKPTYVLFTVTQIFALVVERSTMKWKTASFVGLVSAALWPRFSSSA